MEIFLIIIGVIFCWHYLSKPSDKSESSTSIKSKPTNTSGMFTWPTTGNYDFEVVGESNYQRQIESLAKSKADGEPREFTAILTPEDNNQYDNKAVKVEIDGLLVGYLSRDDARSFRRRLGTKKLTGERTATKAIITGGNTSKNGKKYDYGVSLDLKPFDN